MTTKAATSYIAPRGGATRRALGAALMAGAAAATVSASPADAALLRAVAQFHAADRTQTALNADPDAVQAQFDAAVGEWHDRLDEVMALPATTLAGIKARASCLRPAMKALLGCFEEEVGMCDEYKLALLIADDLRSLEG